MNERKIVLASLVWVLLLTALSRKWIADVRSYVRRVTGHTPEDATGPSVTTPARPSYERTSSSVNV